MKKEPVDPLKIVVLTALAWACMAMVPLSAMMGLQPAAASSKYGILGRAAPELELDTWIGSDGNAIAPIRLGDYRGKVVFLYFFQDW